MKIEVEITQKMAQKIYEELRSEQEKLNYERVLNRLEDIKEIKYNIEGAIDDLRADLEMWWQNRVHDDPPF